MQTDFLLIGQGICGTFLSWYLQQAGFSVLVMDEQNANAPSRVAAGIINPVTGRRIVQTWLIDEVLPAAWSSYKELETVFQVTTIAQKDITDFFPTPQMKEAYAKRYTEDTSYLRPPVSDDTWRDHFNYDFGYGQISPCYLVNLPELLPAYRQKLQQQGTLIEEHFDHQLLVVQPDHIEYKDITAGKIIFCDGLAAATGPFFSLLPFAPNKGEALLVRIPGLPDNFIFKKGMNLVPWKDDIFWIGSSYEWNFTHDQPSDIFRERMTAALRQWVKAPFELLEHKASVRPATLERRPFIGFHPLHPAVGIFNGMGTKGCSLGPFFAKELAAHLKHQTPLHPEVDIQRFRRILSKQ
ncbi:MAG: FAD-dependent oxidoreductase [Chitinophagaceae bacterium]